MDALLLAAGVVLPVVAVLGVGNAFAGLKNFKAGARELATLVFWVCLPILILRDIARSNPVELFDARLCVGAAAVLFLVGVIGYRYARLIKAAPAQVGVIAQAAFRCNMLYVGLPVLLFHVAATHAQTREKAVEHAGALAAMALAAVIPVLNGATVLFFVLARRHEAGRKFGLWSLLKPIVSNPLIIAVLVGLPLTFSPAVKAWLGSDTVLGRTLDLLGAPALPMALLAVGAVLDLRRVSVSWRRTLPIALLKLVLMPALGLAVLWHLGLRDIPLAVGVVLLACPTAAASQPMAQEMGGDDVLAGDLVAITTVLCPFTLVVWLTILQKMQ